MVQEKAVALLRALIVESIDDADWEADDAVLNQRMPAQASPAWNRLMNSKHGKEIYEIIQSLASEDVDSWDECGDFTSSASEREAKFVEIMDAVKKHAIDVNVDGMDCVLTPNPGYLDDCDVWVIDGDPSYEIDPHANGAVVKDAFVNKIDSNSVGMGEVSEIYDMR